jgi:hypothetical protein
MAAIPCENRSTCIPCADDNALINFSSEDPDVDRFLGGGGYIFNPPLGYGWSALSCYGWCFSSVSQLDADLCALNAQQRCVVNPDPTPDPVPDPNYPPPGPGPYGNPPWKKPDGNQVELFPNQAQSCTVDCPDGSPFTYTVLLGAIYNVSQAQANYQAHGLACKLAKERMLCITSTSPLEAACIGSVIEIQLAYTGAFGPFTWSITGGSLPPGLSMTSGGLIGGIVDVGASGDYTFTATLTDGNGNTISKNFVIGVCGATNSDTLDEYTIGSPYSVFITGVTSVGCGLGTHTFALIGTLPPGLSLNTTTGEISGTPTGAATGDYTFTVQVITAA